MDAIANKYSYQNSLDRSAEEEFAEYNSPNINSLLPSLSMPPISQVWWYIHDDDDWNFASPSINAHTFAHTFVPTPPHC